MIEIPPNLAATLDHIIGQLDIITKTISILDQRLTNTEDQVSLLISHTRGLQQREQRSSSHINDSQFDSPPLTQESELETSHYEVTDDDNHREDHEDIVDIQANDIEDVGEDDSSVDAEV